MSWFVTGTDTGVGKTLMSAALMTALARSGRRVAGMKPVASGCELTTQGLRSADAEVLRAAANVAAEYADVNPYAFAPATAPHLAAAASGATIDIDTIRERYARLAAVSDAVVVEGIGGWWVPIGPQASMADVARALDLPVILVVGLRLGCLNHALLTQAAIHAHGCRLCAWVANDCDGAPLPGYRQALSERLALPCLGAIPHATSVTNAASCLDLALLSG
jgi:dethiobiotin synthetase